MSINDPQQNISIKITFYFNILKPSILDFFWELPMYWNRKVGSFYGWMMPKVPILSKSALVELVDSADSSLRRLILLIFHNVFWSYTVRVSEILGHLCVFFKVSDVTTGFLDENWSSIVNKIKNSPYTFRWFILPVRSMKHVESKRPEMKRRKFSENNSEMFRGREFSFTGKNCRYVAFSLPSSLQTTAYFTLFSSVSKFLNQRDSLVRS